MGLIAREIEDLGIATISLSIVKEITEKAPPPRAIFFRFPIGHALGEMHNRRQHLEVLYLAFRQLFAATTPGEVAEGGLRWRRDVCEEPDWEAWRRLGIG